MEETGADTFDKKKMIADYMENGLLENIVDMFKHDELLYEYSGDLLSDERMRVKIGTVALFEELGRETPDSVRKALPSVLSLLKDKNPVVRGDAAYVLGIIGDKGALPFLENLVNDEDTNVRLIVQEAIEDIRAASNPVNTRQ